MVTVSSHSNVVNSHAKAAPHRVAVALEVPRAASLEAKPEANQETNPERSPEANPGANQEANPERSPEANPEAKLEVVAAVVKL